ncbi:MAG: hypothetical protein CO099_08345 [Bdellovibrio sp. CG_4_9_14_3_um_filter_39_7]|nr:MAG: hypothetical protein CO099_08345 [Bdellovibrio sp. CG_4_9_14_3_um_filter_39_7]
MKFFKKLKKFLEDVAHDERIPERDKKVLIALMVLLVSPFDIIPDWIPVFGLIDDFIILCIISNYFFSILDSQILLSHYPWSMKSFAHMRRVAKVLANFAPGFIKDRIWKYIKDPYS